MKIVIVSPFYPYRGGISQFGSMYYDAFTQLGCEVKAINFSSLYPNFLFPGKTQYVEEDALCFNTPSERILSSTHPGSWKKTADTIEKFAPDAVIFCYWMSFFVPGYSYISRRLKNKTLLLSLVHNAMPHEPRFIDKILGPYFFRQMDGFVVMSDNVAQIISNYTHAPQVLQPHPVYDQFGAKIDQKEALLSLGLDPKKKTLLYFGLIRDYKGLDMLLDAFGKLGSDYQMIIAGECYSSFDKYKQIIASLPNAHQIVEHIHYVPNAEVNRYFSASDLLVLPYKSATQSGVIKTAIHFDLPMVGTPVGSFAAEISQRNIGYISDDISADSLEKSIEKFFSLKDSVDYSNIFAQEKREQSWERFGQISINFINTRLSSSNR